MPFYHKKVGRHGRKTIQQVTREWRLEERRRAVEKAERRKRRALRKRAKQEQARVQRRIHNEENRAKMDDIKAQAKEKQERLREIFRKERVITETRSKRMAKIGRDRALRARQEELLANQLEEERLAAIARDEEREAEERALMKREEEETVEYLTVTKNLLSDILMRKYGMAPANPSPNKPPASSLVDAVSSAKQDLHTIEVNLIRQVIDEDEEIYGDEVLDVDIAQFDNCIQLRGNRLQLKGIRILSREFSPKHLQNGDIVPGACPRLSLLNLSYCDMKIEGAVALGRAFSQQATPLLKILNLKGNNISDSGLNAIVDAGKAGGIPRLTSLLVATNHVSDSGAVSLGHALMQGYWPKMIEIDLKMNRIRCKGAICLLSFLESLGKNKKFRRLNLSSNTIDRRALGRFSRRAAPAGAIL